MVLQRKVNYNIKILKMAPISSQKNPEYTDWQQH